MDEFFSGLMASFYLKVSSYIQLQSIKPATCCKIEAAIQRGSVKKAFKILQKSQENPCARISFLIKLYLKSRL